MVDDKFLWPPKVKSLKEIYKDNYSWYLSNSKVMLENYRGEYVAVSGGQVVEHKIPYSGIGKEEVVKWAVKYPGSFITRVGYEVDGNYNPFAFDGMSLEDAYKLDSLFQEGAE